MKEKVAILALAAILLSGVYISGCIDRCAGRDCGCHTVVSARWGSTFVLSLIGEDLAHKANFTSSRIEVELTAGSIQRDGYLQLKEDRSANGTAHPQLVYSFKLTGPMDTPGSMRMSSGALDTFKVQFYFSGGTSDPYLVSRTFFDGANNITGIFGIIKGTDALNVTVDRKVPGVGVDRKEGDHNRSATLKVATDEWDFEVLFDSGELCTD